MTTDMQCLDCNLKKIQLQLNQPFERDVYDAQSFKNLVASCGNTSYAVTAPPMSTQNSTYRNAGNVTSPVCENTYVAKASDTPKSVAEDYKVATNRLLALNNIPLNWNSSFSPGQILCLDNIWNCVTQTVQPSDTCGSIIALVGSGTTEVMLKSWNPTIGMDCDNIGNMAGKTICISPPGTNTSSQEPEGLPVGKAAAKGAVFAAVSDSNTTKMPGVSDPPTDTESWTWVTATATSSLTVTGNQTSTFAWPPDPPIIMTANGTLPNASSIGETLARAKYCPFLQEGSGQYEYYPSYGELDDECESSWEPYCDPDPETSMVPSPSNIPPSCWPTIVTLTNNSTPISTSNQASSSVESVIATPKVVPSAQTSTSGPLSSTSSVLVTTSPTTIGVSSASINPETTGFQQKN